MPVLAHRLSLLRHKRSVRNNEQDMLARVQAAEVINNFNRDQRLAQASAQVDYRVLGDGMLDARLLVRPKRF